MAILGLLLLLAAAVVTAGVVGGNASDAVNVSVFGNAIGGLTVGGLFVAGLVTGLVALLGLLMLFGGTGRAVRKRREKRQAAKDRRRHEEELRRENERLERELADERNRRATAVPAGSGAATDGSSASTPSGNAGVAMGTEVRRSTTAGAGATAADPTAAYPADPIRTGESTPSRAADGEGTARR